MILGTRGNNAFIKFYFVKKSLKMQYFQNPRMSQKAFLIILERLDL